MKERNSNGPDFRNMSVDEKMLSLSNYGFTPQQLVKVKEMLLTLNNFQLFDLTVE